MVGMMFLSAVLG